MDKTKIIFASRKGLNEHISVTQEYRVLKGGADALNIENFVTHSLRKTWGYWTYKASRYNIGLIAVPFRLTSNHFLHYNKYNS